MLQRTLGCIYLFKWVVSFSSGKYPEVKLLDRMVVLLLIFWGNSILFSTVTIQIYISTNFPQAFPFLHILTNTCYLLSFLKNFLNFIYFFIQQVLISHQFYTHQCIHVNPNHPIHHTPTPTPPPLTPLGDHTFVLYICVSIPALQTGSSVSFF